MQFLKIVVPLASVGGVALAYRSYGWGGVALAVGALVMWMLLQFSRMLQVLRRAANRPMGTVDSAVMLNAKLRPDAGLLHVLALTRALGERLSDPDVQPEIFRWTDASESHVTCEFSDGRLKKWELVRPATPAP